MDTRAIPKFEADRYRYNTFETWPPAEKTLAAFDQFQSMYPQANPSKIIYFSNGDHAPALYVYVVTSRS